MSVTARITAVRKGLPREKMTKEEWENLCRHLDVIEFELTEKEAVMKNKTIKLEWTEGKLRCEELLSEMWKTQLDALSKQYNTLVTLIKDLKVKF